MNKFCEYFPDESRVQGRYSQHESDMRRYKEMEARHAFQTRIKAGVRCVADTDPAELSANFSKPEMDGIEPLIAHEIQSLVAAIERFCRLLHHTKTTRFVAGYARHPDLSKQMAPHQRPMIGLATDLLETKANPAERLRTFHFPNLWAIRETLHWVAGCLAEWILNCLQDTDNLAEFEGLVQTAVRPLVLHVLAAKEPSLDGRMVRALGHRPDLPEDDDDFELNHLPQISCAGERK